MIKDRNYQNQHQLRTLMIEVKGSQRILKPINQCSSSLYFLLINNARKLKCYKEAIKHSSK